MLKRFGLYFVGTIGVVAALALAAPNAHAACAGGTPNGIEEAGEACDFGSDPADCCSDTCAFLSVGTACNDYDLCSMNTTCDSEGQCSGVPDPTKPSGTDCDDHNDCTTSDDCNATGHCVGGAGQTGEACYVRAYDNVRADCKTRTCEGKFCTGEITADPCDDGNACTTDTCTDPQTITCSPSHPAIPVGQPCDTDENACTVETCHDDDLDTFTTCELDNTVTCTDTTPTDCKYPSCNATTGACDTIKKKLKGELCTEDGNICTSDQCNSKGGCTHPAVTIPTACNDGNSCTGPDACDGKNCAAGPAVPNGNSCIDDGNACTKDYCASAVCAHAATNPYTGATANGQVCTDGNSCTATSACSGGACAGTACNQSGGLPTGTCSSLCGNPACTLALPACGCAG